ncbi:hypothetical protein [Rhizobium sp. MHM7A]|uniref:hypothetical protein n=1 Tax=Rhizobium sp. MHM7A TaxID=2583233 RepID=UPI0011067AB5|nr:hypothetical protein [Rhizobium sp. MHM7A]TLX16069.1 hypothetical protein FFR93_01745 [Rhizobium sp. MHM7A]
MVNVEYQVEIGVEGTREMRALANELGHPSAFTAARDEVVRFVCCCESLLDGLGVEDLTATSLETRHGFQLSISAVVKEPELLSQAAIKRYIDTWPATRAPDPWQPKCTAEALFTLVTNLTPAIESDHSECFWVGIPKFTADDFPLPTSKT